MVSLSAPVVVVLDAAATVMSCATTVTRRFAGWCLTKELATPASRPPTA
jgi:hypothetical protein